MELPVPTAVPSQLLLYQCHEAPAPKLPPLTVSVVLAPEQIVDVPVILVGAVDNVLGSASNNSNMISVDPVAPSFVE